MSIEFDDLYRRFGAISEEELNEKLKNAGLPQIPQVEPRKPGPLPPINLKSMGRRGKPENETTLFGRARWEIQIVPVGEDDAKFSVFKHLNHTTKPPQKSGCIEWRPLRRNLYALRIEIRNQLAFDLAGAVCDALFRQDERRYKETTP